MNSFESIYGGIEMMKNENVEKYTVEMQNLLEEAKANGVEIQPYEKKIENSDLTIERGIAVYTCDAEINYIPTWKLAK